MPIIESKGAASAQGFGEFAKTGVANYIEDVFSTWLYTGNGPTQTITNGIDLASKGGMVWLKNRQDPTYGGTYSHYVQDTVRGMSNGLVTNTTAASAEYGWVGSLTSTSFNVQGNSPAVNASDDTYVSWTFRKQPKFFDVVTWTGDGSNRTISHNLGSVPGCIMIKRTDTTGAWAVYHRSLANTEYLVLNTTAAKATGATYWNSTTATSTEFSLGTATNVNANGGTYVAYLFAHNAGGFGLTGTDNVISCGSFTTAAGSPTATINLGYEPQWLLLKSRGSGNWFVIDNMRGWSNTSTVWSVSNALLANASDAESNYAICNPTSTGFELLSNSGQLNNETFIYIAIRRGPMKVPTDATKVFNTNQETTSTNPQTLTTGFPVDLSISFVKNSTTNRYVMDRLRGGSTSSFNVLYANQTNAEETGTNGGLGFDNNTGLVDKNFWNYAGTVLWNFRRAPGFFDEVCWSGNSTYGTTINHNLGVTPELMIVKVRNQAISWPVYSSATGATKALYLDLTNAPATSIAFWNNTAPTSSVFTVGGSVFVNEAGSNYVGYLFASCPGVSKVGSYTGNGTTQTINCGFAGGARFVLIKRTDSTGNWYVYDTARGMTTLTDPYLLLNIQTAEVATLGSVTTVTTGFAVDASILAAVNTNAATYIFLAIA